MPQMYCTLYYNHSDNTELFKEIDAIFPQDADHPEIPIHILQESNVVDPTFQMSAATNIMNANYMYVPNLARFYFINEYKMKNGYLEITAHVDVLMSYNQQISNMYVMLDRQEQQSNFNLYLPDSMPLIDNPDNIRTIPFGGIFNETSDFLLILAGSGQ